MLCQYCGKKEVNVRYTQIINGVKKQMNLCDECARKLGIGDFSFRMPSMSFSNILGNMFSEEMEDFFPSFTSFIRPQNLLFGTPSTDYQDFIETGLFDEENNHQVFEKEMDNLLKRVKKDNSKKQELNNKQATEKTNCEEKIRKNKEETKEIKLKKLQERLQMEIKEERYEDAAITRDEIKKLENK